jgi:hypothetical protein
MWRAISFKQSWLISPLIFNKNVFKDKGKHGHVNYIFRPDIRFRGHGISGIWQKTAKGRGFTFRSGFVRHSLFHFQYFSPAGHRPGADGPPVHNTTISVIRRIFLKA